MGPFFIAQVNDIGQSLDGLVNLEFYDKKSQQNFRHSNKTMVSQKTFEKWKLGFPHKHWY